MMSHILAMALILGAGATSPAMPQAFQGDWYEPEELPTCADVNVGDGHFQVRAQQLEDPLAEYKITAVHPLSPTSVHVQFVYNVVDQNISKKGSAILTLQDNGSRLVGTGEGDLAREYISGEFHRCSK